MEIQEVAKLANNSIELSEQSAKLKRTFHQIISAIRLEVEVILERNRNSFLNKHERENNTQRIKHLLKSIKDTEISLGTEEINQIERMSEEISDYRDVLTAVSKDYGPELYYQRAKKVLDKYRT